MRYKPTLIIAAAIALGSLMFPGLHADSLPNDIPSLEKLAKNKNEEAQLKLARKYIKGDGVAPDAKKAEKWLKKAADEGSNEAQYELGKLYFEGIGGKPDYKNAIKWFSKAAPLGNFRAQFMIGECYFYGFGEKQNYESAFEWYKKASYTGYAPAEYMVGRMYLEGLGTAVNEEEAARLFAKAAEKGFREAQYTLGLCYEEGLGVERDMKEADKWFLLAAENKGKEFEGMPRNAQFGLDKLVVDELQKADAGEAVSMNRIGNMAYYGIGMPKNENSGVSSFLKAAEGGLMTAQTKLGSYYFVHSLIAPDFDEFKQNVRQITPQAVKWWEAAAEQGDALSQLYLGLTRMLEGTPGSQSQGFEFLRKSALQGNTQAQYFLALCYDHGEGTRENKDEAARWMKEAAEKGFPEAEMQWGRMLYQGVGCVRNTKEAVEWWKKASDHGNPTATMLLVDANFLGRKYSTAISWCKILERQTGVSFGNHLKFEAGFDYFEKGSYEDAVEWFEAGADAGNANSIFMLGYCYNEGLGLPQSYKKAFELWQQASELNSQAATVYLGLCYQLGTGTTEDYTEAVSLFRKAADMSPYDGRMSQNSRETAQEAAHRLDMILDGTLAADSLYFLRVASDYNAAELKSQIESDENFIAILVADGVEMTPDGHLVPAKKFPKGVDFPQYDAGHLLRSLNIEKAQEGDVKALFALGTIYYYGIDVDYNPDLAYLLFSLAARKGYEPAKVMAGRIEDEIVNGLKTPEPYPDDLEFVEEEEDY